MINDTCDYCFRELGREPGQPAVCPSCGLENVRPVRRAIETATPARVPERAVRVSERGRRVRPGKVA